MRQAGRYLPEYREIRKRLKFLELCADVPSAIEVTLQPFRRFGMDGIVVFSDILIPLPPMGIEIRLDDEGPQIPRAGPDGRGRGEAPELRSGGEDEHSCWRSFAG